MGSEFGHDNHFSSNCFEKAGSANSTVAYTMQNWHGILDVVPVGSSSLCKQSLWRAHRYWATVPQSPVHSESVVEHWTLLCGSSGHDQREGRAT